MSTKRNETKRYTIQIQFDRRLFKNDAIYKIYVSPHHNNNNKSAIVLYLNKNGAPLFSVSFACNKWLLLMMTDRPGPLSISMRLFFSSPILASFGSRTKGMKAVHGRFYTL